MKHFRNMKTWLGMPLTAAALLSAALICTPSLATERVVLGNTQSVSLHASQDPRVTATVSELKSKVKGSGTVRVIVGIAVPFAPEGRLEQPEQARQRAEIAATQKAVLGKLPAAALANRQPKKFATIPYVGLEVTERELDELIRMPEVTSIEEDAIAEPSLAQSVPLVGMSGGNFGGFNGAGQTVAILDTGVDKNHPDLAGRVVSEACYSTTDGTSQSICPGGASQSTDNNSAMPYASGVCASTKCDHGTHVAGIAAGAQGVARGANIIAVQVFSAFPGAYCNGGTPCALSYVTDQILGLERVNALRGTYNIAAANMSLGGGRSYSNCDASAQKAIIDTLRSNGIATVIASGNSGYSDSMGAPACISSAVSVGATWDAAGYSNVCGGSSTSSVDSVACYSNSASFLHLLAPGSLINAPIPNGSYGNWNGTSMATPHVAGAWAVLKHKAPAASVDAVLQAFIATGTPVLDPRNTITKPRINVAAAVASLGGPTGQTLNVTKTGTGSGTVTSSPSGISCGSDCSESYTNGTIVTLSASPSVGSTFGGWSGSCTGTSTCTLTMSEARNVSATFTAIPQSTLSIAKVGTGTGTVTRTGGALNCGVTCSESVPSGTIATLTAIPGVGSSFGGWTGGTCAGDGSCGFTVNTNLTVTALFNSSAGGNTIYPLLETNRAGNGGASQSYTVTVPQGAKNLVIQISGGSGDADMYVKFSQLPTFSSWDCRPYKIGNEETCTFTTPAAGTYHVMLHGYTQYSGVTLAASYQKTAVKFDITPIIQLLLD